MQHTIASLHFSQERAVPIFHRCEGAPEHDRHRCFPQIDCCARGQGFSLENPLRLPAPPRAAEARSSGAYCGDAASPGGRWMRLRPGWRAGCWIRGCKPGDRVAVCSLNSIELVQVYLGLFKAGLIAVTINTRLKPDEVQYILGHAQPRMAFCKSCSSHRCLNRRARISRSSAVCPIWPASDQGLARRRAR